MRDAGFGEGGGEGGAGKVGYPEEEEGCVSAAEEKGGEEGEEREDAWDCEGADDEALFAACA